MLNADSLNPDANKETGAKSATGSSPGTDLQDNSADESCITESIPAMLVLAAEANKEQVPIDDGQSDVITESVEALYLALQNPPASVAVSLWQEDMVAEDTDSDQTTQPLDQGEHSLTDEQRLILKAMSNFRDDESYLQTDAKLEVPAEGWLIEAHSDLLKKSAIDQKPFDKSDASLPEQATLSEEHRLQLKQAAALPGAREAFYMAGYVLEADGLMVSDDDRRKLEQGKSALSVEQQKEIFRQRDPRMRNQDWTLCEDFVEPVADKSESDDTPPPGGVLFSGRVCPEDYEPLLPMSERPGKPVFLGTVVNSVSSFFSRDKTADENSGRRPITLVQILGSIILVGICIAIYVVPTYLKRAEPATGTGDVGSLPATADRPQEQEQQQLSPAQPAPVIAAGSVSSVAAAPGTSQFAKVETVSLSLARSFDAAGRPGAADSAYEAYLIEHPHEHAARIEYVRFLIKSKFRTKARRYCIAGMKRVSTETEKNEIWSLWQQVLAN